VPKGLTLTIEPGVIVKFHGEYSLIVDGDLVTAGTSEQNVVFTSMLDDHAGGDTNKDGIESGPTPLDWNGIFVRNGKSTVKLKNTVICNCLRPLTSNSADVLVDSLFLKGNSVFSIQVAADTVAIAEKTPFSRRFLTQASGAATSETVSKGPVPWYRKPAVVGGTVVGAVAAAGTAYLVIGSDSPKPQVQGPIADPPGPPQ